MQCTLPTQGMRSIISTVSISPEGFLPSILLLMVIIVTVVMVTVILVVVVVAIVGVVIVVAIIGVFVIVMIIRVVVVVVVGSVPPIIKLSFVIIEFGGLSGNISFQNFWVEPPKDFLKLPEFCLGEILIGQEPFQFGPGDLVGLFNSEGISLGPVFLLGLSAFAMVVSYASKVGVIPLVISAIQRKVLEFKTSRVDLTSDEDPTDEDGDIGVSVSLGDEIFSKGKESRVSNIGDSDNTGDGGKTAGKAIITWGGGIVSLISESEGTIVE
ncbi:hypothetical protein Tco_1295379 [Tanacetum coccineum]